MISFFFVPKKVIVGNENIASETSVCFSCSEDFARKGFEDYEKRLSESSEFDSKTGPRYM
jgi:hypothetical protein